MGGVENSKTSVCLKWRKEHVHTVVHGNLTAELLGLRSRLGALSSFSPANHWGKNRGLSEICKRKIICKSKKCPLLKWMRIFHIYSCLCPFDDGWRERLQQPILLSESQCFLSPDLQRCSVAPGNKQRQWQFFESLGSRLGWLFAWSFSSNFPSFSASVAVICVYQSVKQQTVIWHDTVFSSIHSILWFWFFFSNVKNCLLSS